MALRVRVVITNSDIDRYYFNMAKYFRALTSKSEGIDPLKRNTYLKSALPAGTKISNNTTKTPSKYFIAQQSIFNNLMKNSSFLKMLKNQVDVDEEVDSNNLPPLLLESIYRDIDGKELIKLAIKGDKDIQKIIDNSDNIPVTTVFESQGKVMHTTVTLTSDKIKEKFLEAQVAGSEIRVYLSDEGADKILAAYDKANRLLATGNITKISKAAGLVTKTHVPTVKDLFLGFISDSVPRSPLSVGKITENKNKYKGGKLLSEVQFSALLRKAVIDDSPKGPPRGPALSNRVLTYRTGRYANSIRVTKINFRNNQIEYFYYPVYRAHENKIASGRRAPSRHIGKHIRDLAKQVYGINAKPVLRAR
jgi:hypothetical protein